MAKIILNVELNSDKVPSGIKKIRSEIASLGQEFGKIKNAKDVTDGIKALTTQYEKLTKTAEKVIKANQQIQLNEEKLNQAHAKTVQEEAKAEQQKTKLAEATVKLLDKQKKLIDEQDKLTASYGKHLPAVKEAEKEYKKYNEAQSENIKLLRESQKIDFDKLFPKKEIKETNEATIDWNERLKQSEEQIDKIFGNAAIRLWRTWFSEVKKILDDLNDTLDKTEQTVIELQRVLNDNVSNRQISTALYNLAQQYGQTFANASTIAQNFAKSGMSWDDTIKATESALLAMNVAELNASESSEGLLSIMVQFKKEAGELETVVDQLNKTADKNPVTTEKLLKALQRTGSAAVTSNLSLEKTIGIITALSAATNRSGQNIGTATNALIMYTQKNLDVFAAMSEESAKVVDNFKRGTADVVDIWRVAQDEITKLKNNKDRYNSLLDLFGDSEGMEELNSSLHDELEDTFEQINSVYSIANTYRKNYFIALLDNLDRFDKALENLEDTQDYSRQENEKYMSTYEAKLNTLTAKWQSLANDEQGVLKFRKDMIDLANGALDIVDGMGGIVNVLMTITGLVGGLVITIKSASIAKRISEATSAFAAMGKAIQGVATAGEAAQASLGWIGLAIAALTAIVGVVNAVNSANEKARQAIIDTADSSRGASKELYEQYKKLTDLDDKSDEYYQVEDKIVTLLGDKVVLLEKLSKGTEEYSEKVKQLTEQELYRELARQRAALQAYEVPDEKHTAFYDAFYRSGLTDEDIFNAYNEGRDIVAERINAFGNLDKETQLAQMYAFYKKMDEFADLFARAAEQAKAQRDNLYDYGTDAWKKANKTYEDLNAQYKKYESLVNDVAEDFAGYETIVESVSYFETAIDELATAAEVAANRIAAIKPNYTALSGEGDDVYSKNKLLSPEELAKIKAEAAAKRAASGSDGGGGGTGSTTDEYLESLKAAVTLRKSELTLMQHQGASLDEQVAKNKEIQEALHIQAEYLRQKGADQAEINALSSEWYSIQENITKLVKSQYTDEINLIKSRLTLMEHQDVEADKQIELMKDIQSNLHDEAEYLRQIKASEEEINAVSSEWWTWQEKILKTYQDTLTSAKELELDAIEKVISSIQEEIDLREEELALSEKQLAVYQAMDALEEARAKAKIEYVSEVLSNYITALSDAQTLEEKQKAVSNAREKYATAQKEAQAKAVVEAMKAQKELGNDALSLEEKRLAVEEARQALIDARNDRTTRVFDEATGEWHYEANAQNIKSAQERLADAMKSLDDYLEGEAWDEMLDKMEQGSVSEGEMLAIIEKWQSQGYGSSEWGEKMREAYRVAIGTKADPNSVAGELNAVDTAVNNLNSYLKNQAIKELQAYIKDGNTSVEGMQQIMDKWLSMGEGGEIWQWSSGVITQVKSAIDSGKYDDSKISSQIQAVSTAIKNLQNYIDQQFLKEIAVLMTAGSAEDIMNTINKWKSLGASKETQDTAEQYYNAKSAQEEINEHWSSDSYDEALMKEAEGVIGGNTRVNYSTPNSHTDTMLTTQLTNGVNNNPNLFGGGGVMRGASDKRPNVKYVNTKTTNNIDSHDVIIDGMNVTHLAAKNTPLSELYDTMFLMAVD